MRLESSTRRFPVPRLCLYRFVCLPSFSLEEGIPWGSLQSIRPSASRAHVCVPARAYVCVCTLECVHVFVHHHKLQALAIYEACCERYLTPVCVESLKAADAAVKAATVTTAAGCIMHWICSSENLGELRTKIRAEVSEMKKWSRVDRVALDVNDLPTPIGKRIPKILKLLAI